MPYVIRRDRDGAFVAADAGRRGASYTRCLQDAKTFETREQAQKDLCPGNEYVVDVQNVMQPFGR